MSTYAKTGYSQPKKKNRGLLIAVIVLLVLALLGASTVALLVVGFVGLAIYTSSSYGVPSVMGVTMLTIQTDHMYPALKPGDLIIGKEVDPDSLREGDIITYWTVINGERVLNTHRIVEIYDGGGYRFFETKGDTAGALYAHESEIVSKFWFRIPGLGKVMDFIATIL